jgi:pimeloyl-ACP methyl ester carboxylesterase
MMRFVLIHGGFHGAWCWHKVIPELEKIGHQAIAIDLPGHGARRDESSLLHERGGAIVEAMQPGDVLVGHSGGGYDISVAADMAADKVGHLVYLAAGVPIEGQPLFVASGGASQQEPSGDHGIDRLNETIPPTALRMTALGRLEWVDLEVARGLFYHDVSGEDVAFASARLSPAPPEFLMDPIHLPRFWKANLPRSYIICLDDRALPYATAMSHAGRLGVQPHYIDGSHSPFFTRPAELAELFVRAAHSKPVATLRPKP